MTTNKTYYFLLLIFFACNNSSKKAQQSNKPFVPITIAEKEDSRLLNENISLVAEGNITSNWTLLFSQDDTIRFESNDGLKINTAYNLFKKKTTIGRNIYDATTKAGIIKIIINDEKCSIKEKDFEKKVSYSFNNKVYEGCGRYLKDKNIEGIWILEKINGKDINETEYEKKLLLQINLTEKIVKGNDGCNTFTSSIEVQGNRILFNEFVSTEKSCTKKTIQDIINKYISNNVVDYYLKESKLYFYLKDDSLLIFKKL
jgi:META domain